MVSTSSIHSLYLSLGHEARVIQAGSCLEVRVLALQLQSRLIRGQGTVAIIESNQRSRLINVSPRNIEVFTEAEYRPSRQSATVG